jgi:tetratricopeptide (TPR) repeat protein
MTQAQSAEEKARLKKQWTDLAVLQAQEGQWEDAVETNRNILNLFPSEPDAYNRLGKAYSELGQYSEARQAYSKTLRFSPSNTIARKNLERLESLQDTAIATPAGVDRIDPGLFIGETGKTGVTELVNVASAAVLSRVGVGDRVKLEVEGRRLLARNAADETIGQVEPRLANRLITFINGGNRYAAGILTLEHGLVRLIIREEYQHPKLFGTVSFSSRGGGDTVRAYIKDSILRHDREDDDDLGTDDEYYDGGDETEDMSDFDFDGGSDSEE